MSCPATLVAVVVGRAVGPLLAYLDVNGTKDPEEHRDVFLDGCREMNDIFKLMMMERKWRVGGRESYFPPNWAVTHFTFVHVPTGGVAEYYYFIV